MKISLKVQNCKFVTITNSDIQPEDTHLIALSEHAIHKMRNYKSYQLFDTCDKFIKGVDAVINKYNGEEYSIIIDMSQSELAATKIYTSQSIPKLIMDAEIVDATERIERAYVEAFDALKTTFEANKFSVNIAFTKEVFDNVSLTKVAEGDITDSLQHVVDTCTDVRTMYTMYLKTVKDLKEKLEIKQANLLALNEEYSGVNISYAQMSTGGTATTYARTDKVYAYQSVLMPVDPFVNTNITSLLHIVNSGIPLFPTETCVDKVWQALSKVPNFSLHISIPKMTCPIVAFQSPNKISIPIIMDDITDANILASLTYALTLRYCYGYIGVSDTFNEDENYII